VLPSGQELTLSLLATIALEVVHVRPYASFSGPLPFFKCILEILPCESVQRRQRFCLDPLSCIKMAAGWWMTVVLLLVKNSLMEKEV
jgi:hypothetical protein